MLRDLFHLIALVGGLAFLSASSPVFAAGFGEPLLRSYLGQPLNVQVPVSGVPEDELIDSCVKASVQTIDGEFIANPRMEFAYPKTDDGVSSHNAPTKITVLTNNTIVEPAITLSIALQCGAMMQRSYSLLLDHPEIAPAHAALAPMNAAPTSEIVERSRPAAAEKAAVVTDDVSVAPKKSVKKAKRAKVTANVTEEAKPAVKETSRISQKPATPDEQPKDRLKLSNEDIPVEPNLSGPTLLDKALIDVDQQRAQENLQAQERFAAMLRDEPALRAEQAQRAVVAFKDEQLKIERLEKELLQLKLQLQSMSKPPVVEHTVPMSLMVVNAVVLGLLVVLILVVGKLWLSLRKANEQALQGSRGAADSAGAAFDDDTHDDEPTDDFNLLSVSKAPIAQDKARQEATMQGMKKEEPSFDQTSVLSKPNDKEDMRQQGDSLVTNSDGNAKFNLFAHHKGRSVQIEQLSDCTQEAEFWVSVGNVKRAIELLEPQCASGANDNSVLPVSLFYLMDLYRLVGDEQQYGQLAQRLSTRFNISVPGFDDVILPNHQRHLDDYDHITSNCCAFWNTDYILPYLESLLIDDREGARIGFDLSVYRDILFLISICRELDRTKNMSVSSAQ